MQHCACRSASSRRSRTGSLRRWRAGRCCCRATCARLRGAVGRSLQVPLPPYHPTTLHTTVHAAQEGAHMPPYIYHPTYTTLCTLHTTLNTTPHANPLSSCASQPSMYQPVLSWDPATTFASHAPLLAQVQQRDHLATCLGSTHVALPWVSTWATRCASQLCMHRSMHRASHPRQGALAIQSASAVGVAT